MTLPPDIAADVAAIGRLSSVPTLLEVVARTTGMRFTAIARVTDRHWTACAVHDDIAFGLQPGQELVLESTLCNEIRQHGRAIVFGHASVDPDYSGHPTPQQYGFESYVSIPIVRDDGTFWGTLCALDPEPARLDDPTLLRTLQLFAELVSSQLATEERLARSRDELAVAYDAARLRDQFIAVLGHDLRGPLQAILMSAESLQSAPLDARGTRGVERILRSTDRMAHLIDDVLDFARGQLGGGIPVSHHDDGDLAEALRQVLSETAASHPERVHATFELAHAVSGDRRRIAQLFGNLVGNALQHGDPAAPVEIAVRTDDVHFEIAVGNRGPAIPAGARAQLFKPFSRDSADAPRPGLGLGLYIAAEIAKAHLGTLTYTSTDTDGTRFVFRMPLTPSLVSGSTPAA